MGIHESRDPSKSISNFVPKILQYNYISNDGLNRLDKYVYNSQHFGYLENYVFHPLWNRFVNMFPLWLAPNTITFTGFIIFLSQFPSTFFVGLDGAPSWLFFYSAFTMMIYQWSDGCDGKQARRTNSSSPLGQLVDHGIDAFSCPIICLYIQLLFGVFYMPERSLENCIFFIGTTSAFYLSNWSKRYTELFTFLFFDATEGEFLYQIVCFSIGVVGLDYVKQMIPGYDLLRISILCYCPSTFYNCYLYISMVYNFFQGYPVVTNTGKTIKQVISYKEKRNFGPVKEILTLTSFQLCVFILYGFEPHLHIQCPLPNIILMILLFSHITHHVIVDDITSQPTGIIWACIPTYLLTIYKLRNLYNNRMYISYNFYCNLNAVYIMLFWLHYVINCSGQITEKLQIHVFTLRNYKKVNTPK